MIASGSDEIVAVVEKSTNPLTRYEYRVLDTMRTSAMQSEIAAAVQQGYEPAAMLGSPSAEKNNTLLAVVANLIVILEKAVP
jgi:hypothetical protein